MLTRLPADVQSRARRAYALFSRNPAAPGLRFKRVHATRPIYSARIGSQYRALGALEGDDIVWFWVGTHEYERMIRTL